MRAVLLALVLVSAGGSMARAQEAVSFKAADGVTVHAQRYGVAERRGVVVAFHMAGSNKGEYAPIAPRLVKDGFEVIAVDQRSGGSRFGQSNQTAAGYHGGGGYVGALPDLEAALKFAEMDASGRPVVVLGSSYSASLVFVLAAHHPELAGVAAFSPGEYFDGHPSVRAAAAKVNAPIFVTSAPSPEEVAAAKAIIDASPATLKRRYVPRYGVHAASSLREDRNPRGAEAAWTALEGFLNAAVPAKG